MRTWNGGDDIEQKTAGGEVVPGDCYPIVHVPIFIYIYTGSAPVPIYMYVCMHGRYFEALQEYVDVKSISVRASEKNVFSLFLV